MRVCDLPSLLLQLAERKIEALIADNGMRARDDRFADQGEHKSKPDPLWNKSLAAKKEALFAPTDFTYDDEAKLGAVGTLSSFSDG